MKPSREQLEAWIASSERLQQKLRLVIPVACLPAIALFLVSTAAGGFGLLIVALFAICGYWITSSHLAEWQAALEELDNPAPKPRHAGRYER